MKDYEFCITRASDKYISAYTDRDWNKAKPVNSEPIFDKYLDGERALVMEGKDHNNNPIKLNINIKFSNNANYDYFTSESVIHDGTLSFIRDCYEKIISKVCTGCTYPLIGTPPQDGCTINYTVGRFVQLTECGDFGGDDKPWMDMRTTILLPIKYEITE